MCIHLKRLEMNPVSSDWVTNDDSLYLLVLSALKVMSVLPWVLTDGRAPTQRVCEGEREREPRPVSCFINTMDTMPAQFPAAHHHTHKDTHPQTHATTHTCTQYTARTELPNTHIPHPWDTHAPLDKHTHTHSLIFMPLIDSPGTHIPHPHLIPTEPAAPRGVTQSRDTLGLIQPRRRPSCCCVSPRSLY